MQLYKPVRLGLTSELMQLWKATRKQHLQSVNNGSLSETLPCHLWSNSKFIVLWRKLYVSAQRDCLYIVTVSASTNYSIYESASQHIYRTLYKPHTRLLQQPAICRSFYWSIAWIIEWKLSGLFALIIDGIKHVNIDEVSCIHIQSPMRSKAGWCTANKCRHAGQGMINRVRILIIYKHVRWFWKRLIYL